MASAAAQRPPFRADHVGSLLRPKELREAFRRHAQGELSAGAFAEMQDKAIRDVVRLQEEAGLGVVTDGEFRRSSYWGRFVERCSGFEIKPAVFKFRDHHGHEVDFTATYATARLSRTQPLAADEFAFLKQVAKATPKITMPAPSTMHFYRCTDFADPRVYADAEHLLCRPCSRLSPRDRRPCQGGLPLHPARRGRHRHAVRPRHPRQGLGRGPGPRPARRSLHQGHQRLRSRRAERHGRRHPHVPRQFPRPLSLRGRLRVRWPNGSSPAPTPRISCSSTTRRAPATSSRCASCRRARVSSSVSSAPRRLRSSRSTISSVARAKPRSLSISTGLGSDRNAGSHPPPLAIP